MKKCMQESAEVDVRVRGCPKVTIGRIKAVMKAEGIGSRTNSNALKYAAAQYLKSLNHSNEANR